MRSYIIKVLLIIISSDILFSSNTLPEQLSDFYDQKIWTIIKDPKLIDLPDIFLSFKDELGEFDKIHCKKSIEKFSVSKINSNDVYTILATAVDSCDGGNSYGLIFKGESDKKEHVVALIIDYDIKNL